MRVQGHVDRIAGGRLVGWARDPVEARRRVELFVWFDGRFHGRLLANRNRPDLRQAAIGDGRYAFSLPVPTALADGRSHVARVVAADGQDLAGSPLEFRLTAAVDRVSPRPEPAAPGDVTLLAIAKDERPYVEEWIAHHHGLGFRRFVIYDNDSSDGTAELLRQNRRLAGMVEIVPWPGSALPPGEAPQHAAYAHALGWLERRGWLAVFDLDEFLVLRRDHTVQQLLARYADAAALAIGWRLFGSGGHDRDEPGPVTRRFRHCGPHRLAKSIAQLALIERMGPHVPVLGDGSACDERRRPLPDGDRLATPSYRQAQVNHYFSKSREEWNRKRARGRPDLTVGRVRPEQDFARHDLADAVDDTIQRHWPATIRSMETLFPDTLSQWRSAGFAAPPATGPR